MKIFFLLFFLSLLSFITPNPDSKIHMQSKKTSLNLKRNLEMDIIDIIKDVYHRYKNLTRTHPDIFKNNTITKTLDKIKVAVTNTPTLIKTVTKTITNKVLDSAKNTAKNVLNTTKITTKIVFESAKNTAKEVFNNIKDKFLNWFK